MYFTVFLNKDDDDDDGDEAIYTCSIGSPVDGEYEPEKY